MSRGSLGRPTNDLLVGATLALSQRDVPNTRLPPSRVSIDHISVAWINVRCRLALLVERLPIENLARTRPTKRPTAHVLACMRTMFSVAPRFQRSTINT